MDTNSISWALVIPVIPPFIKISNSICCSHYVIRELTSQKKIPFSLIHISVERILSKKTFNLSGSRIKLLRESVRYYCVVSVVYFTLMLETSCIFRMTSRKHESYLKVFQK